MVACVSSRLPAKACFQNEACLMKHVSKIFKLAGWQGRSNNLSFDMSRRSHMYSSGTVCAACSANVFSVKLGMVENLQDGAPSSKT